MSRFNLQKLLEAFFILIVLAFKSENVMADSSLCSIESQTSQGGILKGERGVDCVLAWNGRGNGDQIAADDCKSRGLGDVARIGDSGKTNIHFIGYWRYEYSCEKKYPITSSNNEINSMSSSKYYEYNAINKKEFANRKEVITPYQSTGGYVPETPSGGGYASEKIFSSASKSTPNSLQLLKQQCSELGFKPKTEKFGECVLELKKRDQTAVSNTANTTQQKVIEVKKGDGSPDDSQCISYGYKLGTEAYATCREKLDQNRKLQAQQERRYQEQLQIQQTQEAQRQQAEAEQQQKADRQRRLDGLGLLFRAMQGTGGSAGSTSLSTTVPHFLRSQYYSNGNHMCNYDDGTVINVGAGICPNTR